MGPRARIACIDIRPNARAALCSKLEAMYERHRKGIRFGLAIDFYPSTREELFVSPTPHAFVIGAELSVEAAHSLCAELKQSYPTVPVLVFLSEAIYSLRVLRRFESVCDDIFSDDDSELRVIHSLFRFCRSSRIPQLGKIINCIGVKGGIGTTTATLSFADSLCQRGSRVAVIDLSRNGVIPFYLGCGQWESKLLADALRNDKQCSPELISDCIVKSPTGISVMVPPSGMSDVRDVWLHSPKSLELSIALITQLCEEFDYILVDSAHAEGLLPFAIACRATHNCILTSNEPASVHLAGQLVSDILATPGDSICSIVPNAACRDGLRYTDIVEFLERYSGFAESSITPDTIPYDTRGRYWIGTGSTFYSHSSPRTRERIDQLVESLLGRKVNMSREGFFRRFLRQTKRLKRNEVLYLPAPSEQREIRTINNQSLYTPPRAVEPNSEDISSYRNAKQQ